MTMDPVTVRSSADWKLQFLREFAEFLERWQQSGQPGLTRETFLAICQTCLSVADCASYLLDMLGFSYVLLGHLQSDPIEARFGWLRQLSGANYWEAVAVPTVAVPTTVIPTNWRFWRRNGSVIYARLGQVQVD